MRCIVCDSPTEPFFTKKFSILHLESVEYVRCSHCGCVLAKTIIELSQEQWEAVNHCVHGAYQGSDANLVDPRWLQRLQRQAEAIAALYDEGIIAKDAAALDYGGGDGKLVAMLAGKGIHFSLYDKYMSRAHADSSRLHYLSESAIAERTFDVVANCSVLEHVRSNSELAGIFALLQKNTGLFALHTLICEEVPQDPDWFYLLAGHTTLYTNAGMRHLYQRQGFKCCFYAVEAQMWFFSHDPCALTRTRESGPRLPGTWLYSESFIDYWKVSPYRQPFADKASA